MTIRLTRAHWQQVALVALLALAALLVGTSHQVRGAEARAAAARAELGVVRGQLRAALEASRLGEHATAGQRRTIDSLWGVILTLKAEARRARQRTVVASDAVATPTLVATLVAERDTALVDRDAARAALDSLHAVVTVLHGAALEHVAEDSLRFAEIGARIQTADSASARAVTVLHRPWWRRLGGGLKATGRTVTVASIGYLIGRVR